MFVGFRKREMETLGMGRDIVAHKKICILEKRSIFIWYFFGNFLNKIVQSKFKKRKLVVGEGTTPFPTSSPLHLWRCFGEFLTNYCCFPLPSFDVYRWDGRASKRLLPLILVIFKINS